MTTETTRKTYWETHKDIDVRRADITRFEKTGKIKLKTIEDFEYAGKNLVFAVKSDAAAVAAVGVEKDGKIWSIQVVAPPSRVMFATLDGLGDYAKLPGNNATTRKFSLSVVDVELVHPEIEDAMARQGKKRIQTFAAAIKFQSILKAQLFVFVVRNHDVFPTQRKAVEQAIKNNAGVLSKAEEAKEKAAEREADAKRTPEERRIHAAKIEAAKQAEFAGILFNRMRVSYDEGNEHTEKAFPGKEVRMIRMSRNDFVEEKSNVAPNKFTSKVNERVMAIYKKGPSDDNPDYAHAREVYEAFNATPRKTFSPLDIVDHNNPEHKYGVFGPFFGRGSTVVPEASVACFATTETFGVALYMTGATVLAEEKNTAGGSRLDPIDFDVPDVRKRSAPAEAEVDVDDNDDDGDSMHAERQKKAKMSH